MCSGTGAVYAWKGLLPTSHTAYVSLHHSSGYQWPCTQGRKMRYSAAIEKTLQYVRWHLGNQNYLHQIAGDIFISSTASGLWLGNDSWRKKKKSCNLIVMLQMWHFLMCFFQPVFVLIWQLTKKFYDLGHYLGKW